MFFLIPPLLQTKKKEKKNEWQRQINVCAPTREHSSGGFHPVISCAKKQHFISTAGAHGARSPKREIKFTGLMGNGIVESARRLKSHLVAGLGGDLLCRVVSAHKPLSQACFEPSHVRRAVLKAWALTLPPCATASCPTRCDRSIKLTHTHTRSH